MELGDQILAGIIVVCNFVLAAFLIWLDYTKGE